uniref:Uncharacterized protein n=1 Tax=Spumella elongata TaxID=89044 RepID=A0A7S3M452_9STRA
MAKPFLEFLTDVPGWERKTWAEYLSADEVDGGKVTQKVTRKDKDFLGGRWGEVIAEGVKAETRGIKNACRDIIDLMVSINCQARQSDLTDLVRRARATESTTRRWIEKGHAKRLPVWEPESLGGDGGCFRGCLRAVCCARA